jgi:hypothetical protein
MFNFFGITFRAKMGNELWYVTEKNGIVRHHFWFSIQPMSHLVDDSLKGIVVYIGLMVVSLNWVKEQKEKSNA